MTAERTAEIGTADADAARTGATLTLDHRPGRLPLLFVFCIPVGDPAAGPVVEGKGAAGTGGADLCGADFGGAFSSHLGDLLGG